MPAGRAICSGVTLFFAAGACGAGCALLWLGTNTLGLTSTSVRANILAFAAAFVAIFLSTVTVRQTATVLRYLFYGLFFAIATRSMFTLSDLREYAIVWTQNKTTANAQVFVGITLGYLSLLLMLAVANWLPRLTPGSNFFLGPDYSISRPAVVFFVCAFILAVASAIECWVVLSNNQTPTVQIPGDSPAVTSSANSTLAITSAILPIQPDNFPAAAILNALVLSGSLFFRNVDAAHATLLFVAVWLYWSLPYGLALLENFSLTRSDTHYHLGASCILAWVSGVFSAISAILTHQRQVKNYHHTFLFDKLEQFARTPRWTGLFLISMVFLVGATVVIYYGCRPEGLTDYPNSQRFMDAVFAFAVILVFVYYVITKSNYARMSVRYLLYGLFAFILMDSSHNFYNLATNGVAVAKHSSTSCWMIYTFSGELAGYLGLIVAIFFTSGTARTQFSLVRTLLILCGVGLIAGTVVLAVNFPVVNERNEAVRCFLMPCFIVLYLLAGGLFHQSVEAVHASLFLLGYYALWILPSIDVIVDLTTEASSTTWLSGLILFGVSVLSIVPAVFAAGFHRQELDKLLLAFPPRNVQRPDAAPAQKPQRYDPPMPVGPHVAPNAIPLVNMAGMHVAPQQPWGYPGPVPSPQPVALMESASPRGQQLPTVTRFPSQPIASPQPQAYAPSNSDAATSPGQPQGPVQPAGQPVSYAKPRAPQPVAAPMTSPIASPIASPLPPLPLYPPGANALGPAQASPPTQIFDSLDPNNMSESMARYLAQRNIQMFTEQDSLMESKRISSDTVETEFGTRTPSYPSAQPQAYPQPVAQPYPPSPPPRLPERLPDASYVALRPLPDASYMTVRGVDSVEIEHPQRAASAGYGSASPSYTAPQSTSYSPQLSGSPTARLSSFDQSSTVRPASYSNGQHIELRTILPSSTRLDEYGADSATAGETTFPPSQGHSFVLSQQPIGESETDMDNATSPHLLPSPTGDSQYSFSVNHGYDANTIMDNAPHRPEDVDVSYMTRQPLSLSQLDGQQPPLVLAEATIAESAEFDHDLNPPPAYDDDSFRASEGPLDENLFAFDPNVSADVVAETLPVHETVFSALPEECDTVDQLGNANQAVPASVVEGHDLHQSYDLDVDPPM